MNVGEDTTLGNSDMAKELVQLLIISNGELKMTGNNTGLLVVACSVTSQLQNLSSEVLENGSEVDGSAWKECISTYCMRNDTYG